MNSFVLTLGRHWNRTAIRWALRRLEHRGVAKPDVRSRNLDLYCFGESPLESGHGDLRLWTWQTRRQDHQQIAHLICGDAGPDRLARLPARFPGALILIHHRKKARIELYRGLDCAMPVFFARRRKSLLVAPEMKAFSKLSSRKRIRRLDPGSILWFDAGAKNVRISDTPDLWKPVPLTTLSYAACQAEIVRLVEEGAREIKATHPGTLALALSGGLDSTITAWALKQAGVECAAFTVWFDSGSSAPPPDLAGARKTADALQIPLYDLRIGPEDIESLARQVVYLIEEAYWRHVETGTYVLRLVSELKSRGFDAVATGLGADGNFAGRVFPSQLGENFQRFMAERRRLRFVLGTLAPTLGIRLLSPFFFAPVPAFSSTLPQEFLVEQIDGSLQGKKILRDAFSNRIDSHPVSARKDFPFNTAGAEALYESQWGSRKEREARYSRWMEEMLVLPQLGLKGFPFAFMPRRMPNPFDPSQ